MAGLAFKNLTIRQLLDIIDYPPEGTALREVLNEGWYLRDHLLARLIYSGEVDGFHTRALIGYVNGYEPDEEFPQQIPRPGVEPVVTEAEAWESVQDITDLMSPEVLAMIREG